MLARQLADLGWQLDVVTFSSAGGGTTEPGNPRVHRVFPGPYEGLLERARAGGRLPAAGADSRADDDTRHPVAGLNWKGRIDRGLRAISSWCLYPDLRREGLPFLRAHVKRLVRQGKYAVAILSHEPPMALELRPMLQRAGIPVIADLGDPVLAGYTPRRWRRRAWRLEADVCLRADRIVVTSDATKTLLSSRHAMPEAKIGVVTQGFHPGGKVTAAGSSGLPLRLAYTGRFYRFRDPGPVLDAVRATPAVRMVLAVPQMPAWIDPSRLPASVFDIRGQIDHQEAIAMQASADVLLVIGNEDPAQVPGKLFEYFGHPIPILYVVQHADDAGARLVARLKRGLVAAPEQAALESVLVRLAQYKREGTLRDRFDLSPEAVAEYSWAGLAERYSTLIKETASGGRIRPLRMSPSLD